MECKGGLCKEVEVGCPGGSTPDACGPITDQWGKLINQTGPYGTVCSLYDEKSICLPYPGAEGCYYWSYEACSDCCWDGECVLDWQCF